jgi:hypothetical protein
MKNENIISQKTMQEVFVKASEGHEISVLGDKQLIKLTGEETDGQLTVILQENFHIIEGELTVVAGPPNLGQVAEICGRYGVSFV